MLSDFADARIRFDRTGKDAGMSLKITAACVKKPK